MANSLIQRITMDQTKDLVGRLALTNNYQVNFSGFNTQIKNHLTKYVFAGDSGLVNDWITRKVGLLCADASLPSSSFATAEVKDNFMGVTQDFAHTRLYTDVDFTFYVDADYTMLRFFEGWMDYISGGGSAQERTSDDQNKFVENKGYYRRFIYPDFYKVDTMTITKFERNYELQNSTVLQYKFINAFPKALTPISVSYGNADILKVTASFNYDRYIVTRKLVLQDEKFVAETKENQKTDNNTPPPNQPLFDQNSANSRTLGSIVGTTDSSRGA